MTKMSLARCQKRAPGHIVSAVHASDCATAAPFQISMYTPFRSSRTTRPLSNRLIGLFFAAAFPLAGCNSESGTSSPAARAVARVSFAIGADTLTVGDGRAYIATVTDAAGTPLVDRRIEYTVTPATVASVTSAGLVTAISPGAATLTARVESIQGSLSLVIVPRIIARLEWPAAVASGVILERGTVANYIPTLRDVRGQVVGGVPVTYTSSDPTVATVDDAGTVRGVALGDARITARAETASASYTVRVVQLSAAIYPQEITTEPGATGQLWAVVRDQTESRIPAKSASFSSSDSTVVQVSGTGTLTARSIGRATIRATLNGTLTATTMVTVSAPTTPLRLAMRYEPNVPSYIKTAGDRAANRLRRALRPGSAWIPTAFDSAQASRCVPEQTVPHDGDWSAVAFVVQMRPTLEGGATGLMAGCVDRVAPGTYVPIGLPAVSVTLLSESRITALWGNGSTPGPSLDLLEGLMLHEMVHGIGITYPTFVNTGVMALDAVTFPGLDAMRAAQNLGFPPGPIRLSADRNHWDGAILGSEAIIQIVNGRMTLSAITLGALRDMGFPANMAAAEITTAAGLNPDRFGPLDPTAPNPPTGGIVSRFQGLPVLLLDQDIVPLRRRPH